MGESKTAKETKSNPVKQRIAEKLNKPDYEHIGKLMYSISESGTTNRLKLYKTAFWKGVWAGLGTVVGATIVVSLLLSASETLENLPIIGPLFELISNQLPE